MVLFGLFRNSVENESSKFIKEVEEKCDLIIDDCFRNPLWLVKASEALKEVGDDLTEKIYRSKVLVLNGTIEQKLRAASEIINVNAISSLIFQFGLLLQSGSSLKKSKDFDAFHSYAKCLFFCRVGDFLSNPNYERRHSLKLQYNAGIAAYAMALNACVNAVVQPGRLEAAIQLEILLLKILLSKNINDYNSACEDPQVGLYLYQCCGGKGLNHEKPFFLRSASLSDHCVLSSISSTKRISKVSIILNEAEVLRKILFVVAYDVEVSLSSLSFLDTFFANLPVVPSDGDLQSFTTDKTMSLLDVKILVIAAAEWLYLQCSSQIRPLNYSPPLSRQLLAVWKCVVEESMEKRKINALSKVKLCNALELTRLRGELPDVRVIAKVFIWLEKYGDPNGRMFKHYGHAIDDLENRTLNNIQSSHTFEPILPKKFDDISIEEESNLFKEIHELLTKKENLEVPESFNSSQSSTINCKKSEEDFKESATAMNPDELIAVATCSEENDGPKVVDVSADKVDIISQSSEDFSAPMVHQPLLKRLKNVADYRLAGSTVELIRVAAVCDLAQDPRRNGFFEAVQCSANNIRNEDRNKSESSHMETGDSTAYLTHFKGVLDDVGRRQYEKLMRMFAMTPPSAP